MKKHWLASPAVAVLALVTFLPACQRTLEPRTAPALVDLIEELSGPAGFFDTHNIITNETSYLQVVDRLEPMGGAYLGVGPEQNFTYIARVQPEWAFIVDLRRENMLQQLMFNALFHQAETPFEYLCWLFSRRADGLSTSHFSEERDDGDLEGLIAALDSAPPDEDMFRRNQDAILGHIEDTLRVPLSESDEEHIRLVYRTLFEEQLDIRFRTFGRPFRSHHPDYRSLLLSRSPEGTRSHFLASKEDYRFVRELVLRGRLVPVVGDFAGPHALRAVGDFLRERGQTVSAFYVSNVEFYLLRSGDFPEYVENVRALPRNEKSLFVRAYFDYGDPHPAGLPGHRSTTVAQAMDRFLELYDSGVYHNYWEISTIDYLP